MRNLLFLSSVLSLSFAFSAACRSDDGGNGDKPDASIQDNPDATVGSSNTIYDVQNENTPVGSSVTLRSVVVTAIDTFGDRAGGMYVQETDGGEFSGVFVFVDASVSGSLAVGDLVDLDGGVKDEFALQDDTTGRKLTEVSPAEGGSITITKVGTADLPTPPVLDPSVLSLDDVEAEKWEGVPITFEGVRYFRTTRTDEPAEISVTGPYRIGGSLTELDVDAEANVTCYSSITGIGDYFFSYKILPRTAADIVVDASGSSCVPAENTDLTCSDNIDNDHNGFADCEDRSCQETVAACTTDSTVVEAQNGTIVEQTRIQLTDVIVTALAADGFSFWVQDEGVAAAFNGLFVFRRDTDGALPANVVVGGKISIAGIVDEFQGELTELVNSEITVGAAVPTGETTLTGISLADLSAMQQYEGVLVDIPNVVIGTGTDNTCTQFCTFTITNGATTLFAADNIFRHTNITTGQCYAMKGVMHYSTFNDRVEVLPLETGMTLNGTGCPQD